MPVEALGDLLSHGECSSSIFYLWRRSKAIASAEPAKCNLVKVDHVAHLRWLPAVPGLDCGCPAVRKIDENPRRGRTLGRFQGPADEPTFDQSRGDRLVREPNAQDNEKDKNGGKGVKVASDKIKKQPPCDILVARALHAARSLSLASISLTRSDMIRFRSKSLGV